MPRAERTGAGEPARCAVHSGVVAVGSIRSAASARDLERFVR